MTPGSADPESLTERAGCSVLVALSDELTQPAMTKRDLSLLLRCPFRLWDVQSESQPLWPINVGKFAA